MRAGLGVVLLASVLAVGGSIRSAPPAAASTYPSPVIVNTANDAWLQMRHVPAEGGSAQDPERQGEFAFVVKHPASITPNLANVDLNDNGSYGDNPYSESVSDEDNLAVTVTELGAGLPNSPTAAQTTNDVYSLVQVTARFFQDSGYGSGDRIHNKTVRARVRLSDGSFTPEVVAPYSMTTSNSWFGAEDYIHVTARTGPVSTTYATTTSSATLSLGCYEYDTSQRCEDIYYRWRNVVDGQVTRESYLDVTENGGSASNYTFALPQRRGRWVVEARMCNTPSSCHSAAENDVYDGREYQYIATLNVDDANPPDPTLAVDNTRPNVGQAVNFTASNLLDGATDGDLVGEPWRVDWFDNNDLTGTRITENPGRTPQMRLTDGDAPYFGRDDRVRWGTWSVQCYDDRLYTAPKSTFTVAPTALGTFQLDWGLGRPSCGLTSDDTWSLVFTQTVTVTEAMTLRVQLDSDDGHSFKVNGTVCGTDHSSSSSTQNQTVNCSLPAGTYPLEVRHTENTGGARMAFRVQTPDSDLSARWTTSFVSRTTRNVPIIMGGDDGYRAFITPQGGSRTAIGPTNQWTTGGYRETGSPFNVAVTAGVRYTLEYEWFDSGGAGEAGFWIDGKSGFTGGGVQVVDFDQPSSPGGNYEERLVSPRSDQYQGVSSPGDAALAGFNTNPTWNQSTSALNPGVYTGSIRVCDNGITICGDSAQTDTASAQFRVSAAPVVSSPVVFVKRGESGVVVPSVSISDSDETASPLGGQASFTSTLTGSGVSLPNGIGQPGNSIGTRSCSAPTNASASDGVAGSQSCTVSVDADAAVGDYVVPFTSTDNNGAQSAAGSLTVRVVYEDNFTSTGVNCLPNSVTAGSRSVCTYTVTDLSRGQGGAALVGAAQSPPAGTVSASSSSSKTDFYPATPSCTLANPVSNTQTCQLSVVNRSPETVSMSGTYVPGSHSASAGGQNLVVSGCTASPVVYNTATLLPAGTPGVGSGTQVGVVVSGVGYNYRPSPGCNTTGGLWGQFATLDTGSGTQTFKTFESPLTGPGSLDDGRWTQDATIDPEFFASFLANATFKMYWASSSQSSLPGSAGYVSGDYSYTITPSPLRGARLQAEGESVEASMVIDADAEPEVDVLNVDGGVVSGLKDRVDAQVGEIASVSRLFFGFFGRAARDGELDSVLGDLDGGASLGDVGVQLGSRAEFAARYGHLGDAEFVDAVFVDVLGRAPTALERDGWVTALGGSATRAGLVVDVVGGAENLWRSEHRDYVVAAYAVLSDRTPSGNDVAKGVDALDLGLPKVSVIEDVAMGLADAAFWNQEGASASVDVDAAPQTISLGEVPSVVTDGESVVLGVSTSSGLWASVSVDGPCELVRGRTVEATGPGTCVVTVSQAGDGEYLAADDVVAEIAVRATQSIDFPALPESGVYGSTVELDAESSAGLVVSYRAEGACVVTGDELLYTTPGVCTVTATQVGDAEVAPAVEVSRSTTSVKAPLEVTLGELPAPAVVGRSVEVSAATSAGLDPVVAASGACTLAGSTLTYTAAGTCELVGSHPGDVNYEPAVAVTASVDVVAPVAQTITFPNLPAAPKVGAKTTLKATSSSGLAVEYTATGACTLTGSTLTYTEAGVECTVTAAQPGSDVVLPAVSVTRTTTPVPGTQTITFSNLPAAPKYGSVTTLNVKASSGLAVSLEVTGGCSLDGMALTYTAAGVLCSVTASQAGDGNWLPAVSVTRSTTPVKATQTITFPALPAGPVGSSFPLAATASSGLPVNYFAAGSCSVEDAVVTYTAAGTVCTVIATQPGDDNWAAANSVTRTRTPTKQAQTITISELPATLARNETTTVTATATSGLPVTITASGRCTINGSTLTMTNSTGKCTVKATQAGNTDWSAAPTLTRTITVT